MRWARARPTTPTRSSIRLFLARRLSMHSGRGPVGGTPFRGDAALHVPRGHVCVCSSATEKSEVAEVPSLPSRSPKVVPGVPEAWVPLFQPPSAAPLSHCHLLTDAHALWLMGTAQSCLLSLGNGSQVRRAHRQVPGDHQAEDPSQQGPEPVGAWGAWDPVLS